MDVLYSCKYITLVYDSKTKCLIQVWTAACTSEEYRDAQKKTVEYFGEKQCLNLISDATNAGILRKRETDWVTEYITPKLMDLGLRQVHVVESKNIFTQKTLLNLLYEDRRVRKGVLVFHKTLQEALDSLS